MASIIIRPATSTDCQSISEVHYAALLPYHEFYGAFLYHPPSFIMSADTPHYLERHKFLVALEADDVVGFVRYYHVDERGVNEQGGDGDGQSLLHAPKSHLKDLWARFNKKEDEMDAVYKTTSKGKRHVYIRHLMVLPQYQRRGIGGELLGSVMSISDAEGLPTFLVATKQAHVLYGKAGFEELGTWTIDHGYWAAELVMVEMDLVIDGERRREGWENRMRGSTEVEWLMVRWPRKVAE